MKNFPDVMTYWNAWPLKIVERIMNFLHDLTGWNNYRWAWLLYLTGLLLSGVAKRDEDFSIWHFAPPNGLQVGALIFNTLVFFPPLRRAEQTAKTSNHAQLINMNLGFYAAVLFLFSLFWPLAVMSFFIYIGDLEDIVFRDGPGLLPLLVSQLSEWLQVVGLGAALLPFKPRKKSKVYEWIKNKLTRPQVQLNAVTVRS